METTKIHRKYSNPKFEYRGISVQVINDSGNIAEIIYYATPVNSIYSISGVELYTGENYVFGSTNRSWSRNYSLSSVPKKYAKIVKELKTIHENTEWSDEYEIREY